MRKNNSTNDDSFKRIQKKSTILAMMIVRFVTAPQNNISESLKFFIGAICIATQLIAKAAGIEPKVLCDVITGAFSDYFKLGASKDIDEMWDFFMKDKETN